METRKLYYEDPFMQTFSAAVLACEPGKKGFDIILDQTAFYPEGGGQPTDTGVLGGVKVLEVHEKGGVITHTCDGALAVGATVEGRIDWEPRFDHMQQHSGEHICSGLICRRWNCDNVGFHMGADTVTIDFNCEATWDELLEIEAAANRYIYENHPIDIHFYRGAQLDAVDYRSKKALEGDVRIVAFPGADCCACCGTHVERSGQVGLVKFLSVQKFRDGVRIEMLAGKRAFDFLSATWNEAKAVSQKLSVKPTEIAAGVEKLNEELQSAKLRIAQLEETVFASIAAQQAGKGDVLLFQPMMKPDSLRKLSDSVGKVCGGLSVVFSGDDGKFNYALVRADGQNIAPLVKAMNAALNGRGGGKGGFAQGSVACDRAAIENFFREESVWTMYC